MKTAMNMGDPVCDRCGVSLVKPRRGRGRRTLGTPTEDGTSVPLVREVRCPRCGLVSQFPLAPK
jgi:hypothetical protein